MFGQGHSTIAHDSTHLVLENDGCLEVLGGILGNRFTGENMKKATLFALIFGLISVAVVIGVVFSPSQCPNEVDEFIECQMKNHGILGVQVAVVDGNSGDLLFEQAYGFRDNSESTPVTTRDAFMLASISKTNVAVALMLLQEKGWLKVTDDVSSIVGFEIRNPAHPNVPITLHHLLPHIESQDSRNETFISQG